MTFQKIQTDIEKLFDSKNFKLINNKKGFWGFLWGITLLSLMLMGFKLKSDLFIFSSLIGLKFFSELVFQDQSLLGVLLLAYILFISVNATFFMGKLKGDDYGVYEIEKDFYY